MTTDATSCGTDLVRELWAWLHVRRWAEAAALLSQDAVVRYPDSGRVLTGPTEFATFNGDYPGRSLVTVLRTLARPDGDGELVVAEVRVDNDQRGRFWCAGFYRTLDGRIAGADEYWVGEEQDD